MAKSSHPVAVDERLLVNGMSHAITIAKPREFHRLPMGFASIESLITPKRAVRSTEILSRDFLIFGGWLPRNLSTLLHVKLETTAKFFELFWQFLGEVGALGRVCREIE